MNSSEFETEATRPVAAGCDDNAVHLELADGRHISAPLWWFPFLAEAGARDRSEIELEFSGIWFPKLDEGLSVKSLLLGWKAPGARSPDLAA